MFDAPQSGTVLKPEEVNGHLLVVEPIEYVPSVTTAFGDSEAVRANVHDIIAQESYEGVMWFSRALVMAMKNAIGKQLLAVMGQGTAKPGQSAPWILVDATGNADAVKAATAYMTARQAGKLTAPAAAAPAPAAAAAPDASLEAAMANLAAAGLTQ